MSLIVESGPGDELVCVLEFHASPEGAGSSWSNQRRFRIGERVQFLGAFRDADRPDHPASWMVRFLAADGQAYSATQTSFLTVQDWDRLKRYFAARLLREPRRPGPREQYQTT